MNEYLLRNPDGFPFGYTSITHIDEKVNNTGVNFGILKMRQDDVIELHQNLEAAYLLLRGECILAHDNVQRKVKRISLFEEEPIALHLAANQHATITALTDVEFAVSEVRNSAVFPTQIYDASNLLESEHRGKGLLNDTAYRIVRTIFDTRNSPHAKLVLGEVITAPGRWSSYPPHHHPQPEIYHYRFTEPQGYGHAECGDHIFKVRQFDTYKILDANDHAQAAAPGYGMYYIWVIRHLDDQPYIQPEFTEDHSWTKSAEANDRVWKGQF